MSSLPGISALYLTMTQKTNSEFAEWNESHAFMKLHMFSCEGREESKAVIFPSLSSRTRGGGAGVGGGGALMTMSALLMTAIMKPLKIND